MKKIFLIIILIGLIGTSSYSQKTNNLTNLSGKIVDENNNPLSVDIFFVNDKGEKKSCKSNAKEGAYSTVLAPGEYDVSVRNYIITDLPVIVIPNTGGYNELTYNFRAKKLSVGLEISSSNPFDANSENLNTHLLSDVLVFMQSNKTTFVEFTLNANDCSFKPYKKKIKVEGKKKATTKEITVSGEEQAIELLEKRKSQIIKYFVSQSIPERALSIKLDSKYTAVKETNSKDKKGKKTKDQIAIPKKQVKTLIAKISKVGI